MKDLFINLQLFSADVNPINVTTQESMKATQKVFWDTLLLENAREAMLFTQFGQKQKMKGNKCEWRKFETFAKALTPLEEGVIPTGQNLKMIAIEGETTQHGDFTAISDRLEAESVDDVIFGATEEMGAAQGETFDTLTRNVLIAGNSVMYGRNGGDTGNHATSRSALSMTALMTPQLVNEAATWLKKNKTPKIDGYYIAIIHPSVAYDLRNSAEWKQYHQYNDVAPIFKGEIGELHGVRFIESTNAKVWGDGAAEGYAAYATLFFGKDAFGVLDPEGEGMEMIIKPKGEIGGPLNQFSTVGYKFCHGAKILYQERLLRVETSSNFAQVDEEN